MTTQELTFEEICNEVDTALVKLLDSLEPKDKFDMLQIGDWNLCKIPNLDCFTSLKFLHVAHPTDRLVFPRLPDTIEELWVCHGSLTTLTGLLPFPKNLKRLYVHDNNLTKLPALPDTLEVFQCSENCLKELPALPKRLERLYCDNNELESLPDFPYTLCEIECHNNYLDSIQGVVKEITLS